VLNRKLHIVVIVTTTTTANTSTITVINIYRCKWWRSQYS